MYFFNGLLFSYSSSTSRAWLRSQSRKVSRKNESCARWRWTVWVNAFLGACEAGLTFRHVKGTSQRPVSPGVELSPRQCIPGKWAFLDYSNYTRHRIKTIPVLMYFFNGLLFSYSSTSRAWLRSQSRNISRRNENCARCRWTCGTRSWEHAKRFAWIFTLSEFFHIQFIHAPNCIQQNPVVMPIRQQKDILGHTITVHGSQPRNVAPQRPRGPISEGKICHRMTTLSWWRQIKCCPLVGDE